MNRDCKDVIAFDPADYVSVVEKMQLDLHEPPMSQVCSFFLCFFKPKINFFVLYFLEKGLNSPFRHFLMTSLIILN